MGRFIFFFVLASLALPAAGKVIRNSDLLEALERVVRKPSADDTINRFDLEPRTDDEDVQADESHSAVVLSEGAPIMGMRDGGDGGDEGELISSQSRDMPEAGTRVVDGAAAVMSKRGRHSVRKADHRNVGVDGGDDGDVVESVARDAPKSGTGGDDGGGAAGTSKRGRDRVEDFGMGRIRDDGEGENGGVPETTDPEITDNEGPDSDAGKMRMSKRSRDDVDGGNGGVTETIDPEPIDNEGPDSDTKRAAIGFTVPATDGNALDNIISLNRDNKNLDEGDIRLPPDGSGKRDAIANANLKWPTSGNYVVLPYVTTGLNADAVNALQGAIDNIQRISCVRIIPRTTQADYISVYSGSGCWSYIGKLGGKQDVSLGPGCEHVRIATHELYHALGFWHEQSRLDRDNYIIIYWENIPNDRRHNFNKYNVGQADYYGYGYDAFSIMHYGNYAFSSNNRKTIDWKANTGLTLSGDRLTAIDIGQLNALYKCNRNCDAFPYNLATTINYDVLRDQLNAGLRLLSANSNADIAQRFWNYITQCQYKTYYATAAVYADVTGYEFHAFIGYGVSYLFRTYSHNFVVYSKPHSEALITSAAQDAVLAKVVAANTDQGCNAQVNRDRAWNLCHGLGCRFVLVVRHGYGVSGYHSLANSKFANYKCGRHCSFWLVGCSDIYEFIYLGF